MNNKNHIREKVLEIFANHRQSSSETYDENNFKRFLTNPPNEKSFSESYSGRSRHIKFINGIQLYFAIYFSLAEYEGNHSLDKFVELIEQKLQKDKSGAVRSLKYDMGGLQNMNQFIVLNVLCVLCCLIIFANLPTWSFVSAVVVSLVLNGLLAGIQLKERSYNMELMKRIKERK